MILALSGKIKSGKSTVAHIIQLLIANKKLLNDYPDAIFSNMLDSKYFDSFGVKGLNEVSGWKQVAFADKLKQIVALLISCTVEQLEDQEFKSSPLGKGWERWYYKFYKLTTNTHDGRVSPYFNTEEEAKSYEFPKYNFNTPIFKKEYLQLVKEELTPRLLLQLIGTEGLRNLIHPNSHINGLFADYKPLVSYQGIIMNLSNNTIQESDYKLESEFPNWIITDVRFPNELQAIKERNGIVIRINRNNYPTERDDIKLTQRAETFLSGNIPEHESETALDNAEFDYVIDNNSDIPHLIEEVRKMLVHFKII